ncbi:unnamed protein product [Cochlearia groenlandica]
MAMSSASLAPCFLLCLATADYYSPSSPPVYTHPVYKPTLSPPVYIKPTLPHPVYKKSPYVPKPTYSPPTKPYSQTLHFSSPTNVNKGLTGVPLSLYGYRYYSDKNLNLFNVGPFYFTGPNPKAAPSHPKY